MAGVSPWIVPSCSWATMFIMSIAGHQIGAERPTSYPDRTDLLTGVVFVAMAVLVVTGMYDA